MEPSMKMGKTVLMSFICAIITAWTPGTSAQGAVTNEIADFPPGEGLRLDFHDAPLDQVLSYMSQAAGFVVYYRPGVRVDGRVDVVSQQPLNKTEAVELLKTVLADHDCSVVQNGRTLTLVNTADIRTETPVKIGANPDLIPRDADVVTQIIPVRSLNPIELNKVLAPLLPAGAIATVDESANALLLTDTQADIHRAAEIIGALDSVSATANTLKVYPLQYADAKALADLVKQLFSPPETSRAAGNDNPGAGQFIRFPGARGLNPGNSGATASDSGRTPVSRVSAVADEHGNSVIVSAPEALLPAIAELVAAVDVPVEDITTVEVFALTNADPIEMADELTTLFPPADANGGDATSAPIQFNGRGGRGGPAVGARQGAGAVDNTGGPSDRARKLGSVLAVPDPRTSSLMVSAAKSLMPQIAMVVAELDSRPGNQERLHAVVIREGDGADIMRVIQATFAPGTVAAASTSLTDPLSMHSTAVWNNQFSSGINSGVVSGVSSGSTSASRGGNAP
jgi:type II secretory pathway component GspD/PulD (secretin)